MLEEEEVDQRKLAVLLEVHKWDKGQRMDKVFMVVVSMTLQM